ncbi:hypothetical protein QQ020_21635 [Fulvivirgaceae bacterium BMA12]|uniref:Uncharacterized protein n=1 Tax=Agaribacillus aureus TaxID=3051825 RepID=A0ABT8LBW6_9BACT|nr:hypothetical protein [Fulvivirgaceae bacterium BMA12]
MIVFNEKEDQLKITIPLSGIEELSDYQSGILGVLRQIDINTAGKELIAHVMSVYKLLGHVSLEEEFFFQNEKLKFDLKKSEGKDLKRKTKKP